MFIHFKPYTRDKSYFVRTMLLIKRKISKMGNSKGVLIPEKELSSEEVYIFDTEALELIKGILKNDR